MIKEDGSVISRNELCPFSGAETDTTKAPDTDDTMTTTTPNPYSTNRNSKQTAMAWKAKIDFDYLQRVQVSML